MLWPKCTCAHADLNTCMQNSDDSYFLANSKITTNNLNQTVQHSNACRWCNLQIADCQTLIDEKASEILGIIKFKPSFNIAFNSFGDKGIKKNE